jgi:O-antigen/teichoic acid export membrane protein
VSGDPYSRAAFKRSAFHFLSGKAVSALLTFATLLWLVRLLPVPEYAAYVTLAASLDVTLALASLGLPWLAARYLPEFRLHAARARLQLLLKRLLTWQSAMLLIASFVLVGLFDVGLGSLGLAAYSRAAAIYLAMVLVDGVGRTVRESLLTTLLQQGTTQISLATRNATFLLLLAVVALRGDVHINDVVIAELAAASAGTVLALWGLRRYARSIPAAAGDPDWREPPLREMLPVARQMYFSYLVGLSYEPQVFLLVLSSHLGSAATATFGFLRSLYIQVSRYLPATLLFNLIRPKLVADYARAGGAANLSQNINLAGKLSLFALMPLIVIVAVAGDELVALLSGGKFPHAGMYFLGLLVGLIPYSQRQLLETAAVATGHGNLCLRASSSGLLMLPLMILLLAAGFGLWAPVFTISVGNLLFNTIIQLGLRKRIHYVADLIGWIRLLAIVALTYLSTALLVPESPPHLVLLLTVCLVAVLYLAAARWVKPFSESERASINLFLGRRLFHW